GQPPVAEGRRDHRPRGPGVGECGEPEYGDRLGSGQPVDQGGGAGLRDAPGRGPPGAAGGGAGSPANPAGAASGPPAAAWLINTEPGEKDRIMRRLLWLGIGLAVG